MFKVNDRAGEIHIGHIRAQQVADHSLRNCDYLGEQ